MDRGQRFNAFYFNDDLILNQQVDPIASIKVDFLIHQGQCFLPVYLKPSLAKFVSQAASYALSSRPGPNAV